MTTVEFASAQVGDKRSAHRRDAIALLLALCLGLMLTIMLLFQQELISRLQLKLADLRTDNSIKFARGFLDACGVPCFIRYNEGGGLEDFRSLAALVKVRNQVVVIDGQCVSACALFADLARENIRITRRASSGFIRPASSRRRRIRRT